MTVTNTLYEMKAFRPDKISDERKLIRDITSAWKGEIGTKLIRDFEKTVRTWDEPCVFSLNVAVETSPRRLYFAFQVRATSQVWDWVDRGTKRHKIPLTPFEKSSRDWLVFREGYKRKSRVRVVGSYPNGSYGAYIRARQVTHPGIKPREFTEVIADRHVERAVSKLDAVLGRWSAE